MAELIQAPPPVLAPVAELSASPLALLASSALAVCEAVALLPLLHALRRRKALLEHVTAVMLCLREAGHDAGAQRVWRAAQRAIGLIEQRRKAELDELGARLKDLQEAG
jgi:hypothetical protein